MPLYTNTQVDEIVDRARETLRTRFHKAELKKVITGETVISKDLLIIMSLKEAVLDNQSLMLSNANFQALVAYLLHKTNKYIYGNPPAIVPTCIVPYITTQPSNVSVTAPAPVNLGVTAAGTTPFTYQWQKNGVNIVGATSSTYNIASSVTGDSGSYRCVVSNACGSVTSNAATVTVSAAAITGYYYYGDVDYFADLNSGTDNVPYVGTFSITSGNPLNITLPLAAEPNKWHVYKYPSSQSAKTIWFNTGLNSGTIPDSTFRAIIEFGGYKYIISRVAISIDSTPIPTMTFS